jgi:hypothetical protein
VTAEFAPTSASEQPLADAAAAQILMHPQQVDEQPAGIATRWAGADRPREYGTVLAQEDPEIK